MLAIHNNLLKNLGADLMFMIFSNGYYVSNSQLTERNIPIPDMMFMIFSNGYYVSNSQHAQHCQDVES